MRVDRLLLGWITSPAGLWRRGDPMDRPLRFPVPAYLIQTATERILVDTGLHPGAIADPDAHYDAGGTLSAFALEQEASLAEQVDLATLTRVVLTHLHFDHAGGLAQLSPRLPVVLQRREWQAAQDPAAVARSHLRPRDYAGMADRLTLVDGEHDLLGDGSVVLLPTPGHTAGHQTVRVGETVIGGDVAHFARTLDDLRLPVFADDHAAQADAVRQLRRLRDADGLTVLPGHDPDLLVAGPVPAATRAA